MARRTTRLIIYEFTSGAMGETTYSYASRHTSLQPAVEATVTLSGGEMLLFTDGTLHIYRAGQPAFMDRPGTVTMTPLVGNGISAEAPHFAECIRHQQQPAITAWDARRALELVLLARQSAQEGRTLPAPTTNPA